MGPSPAAESYLRGDRIIEVAIATGAEAIPSLLRHGVKARAVEVSRGSRDVGQAILEEAGALGADLLVKGAYTTGRLRQLVFGGATSHIMTAAELPVLMAH